MGRSPIRRISLEATTPENVDTVVVDGRILKRKGKLVAIDTHQVVAEARTALVGRARSHQVAVRLLAQAADGSRRCRSRCDALLTVRFSRGTSCRRKFERLSCFSRLDQPNSSRGARHRYGFGKASRLVRRSPRRRRKDGGGRCRTFSYRH